MVAVAHLLGTGLDARVGTLQEALDSLEAIGGADRERARLHSAMAAAYLVDDRLEEAITHGERGRAESRRIGDDEAALNAAATLGSVLVFAGRMDEGWQLLEEAIAGAGQTCQEAEAARGYRMVGSSASELMEYDRAERWLTEGVRYAENAELWNHRHYMDVDAAEEWRARVGAVLTARAIPGTLLAIGHGEGLILLARGDMSAAHQALESAKEAWCARRRFWEGTSALLDLAAAAARARRRAEAALLLEETRTIARAAGATTLVDDADRLTRSFDPGRPAEPWYPLSEREYEVAQLVEAGLTNRHDALQRRVGWSAG